MKEEREGRCLKLRKVAANHTYSNYPASFYPPSKSCVSKAIPPDRNKSLNILRGRLFFSIRAKFSYLRRILLTTVVRSSTLYKSMANFLMSLVWCWNYSTPKSVLLLSSAIKLLRFSLNLPRHCSRKASAVAGATASTKMAHRLSC